MPLDDVAHVKGAEGTFGGRSAISNVGLGIDRCEPTVLLGASSHKARTGMESCCRSMTCVEGGLLDDMKSEDVKWCVLCGLEMRRLEDGTIFCGACDSDDDDSDDEAKGPGRHRVRANGYDDASSSKREVMANPLGADSCECRGRSSKRGVTANPLEADSCECRV